MDGTTFAKLGAWSSAIAIGLGVIAFCTLDNPADIPWKTSECSIIATAENKYHQTIRCADGRSAVSAYATDELSVTGQTVTISQDPGTGKWTIGRESTQVDNPLLIRSQIGTAVSSVSLIICLIGISANRRR